jgi:hypothetical protein
MAAARARAPASGSAVKSTDPPFDAVAGGAAPELGAGGELLGGGRRIGVAVVLDHEQHRQREQRGEIHRLVHVAGARAAVAEEGEADGGTALAALGIGGAGDGGEHGAEVADHRQRATGGVAVVDVALAGLGGAAGVGEILVEVLGQSGRSRSGGRRVAVGEGRHVDRLVGEQRERHDQGLVALAAGDGAANQALAEKLEDAVVGDPRARCIQA